MAPAGSVGSKCVSTPDKMSRGRGVPLLPPDPHRGVRVSSPSSPLHLRGGGGGRGSDVVCVVCSMCVWGDICPVTAKRGFIEKWLHDKTGWNVMFIYTAGEDGARSEVR